MKRITKLIQLLRKEVKGTVEWHKDLSATIEWHKNLNAFEVLIGTILSQRTKDENTRKAAAALFARYKTPKQIANASLKNLQKLIKPSGFYKVKAKRIKQVSRILLKKYKGRVPKDFDELIKLPGVGRKTANCVLVFGYKVPAIPVDVHVNRISNRLGLVKTKTPEQTEAALEKIIPKRYWIEINELMVKFGQNKCLPRKPRCPSCLLRKMCMYPNKTKKL